MLEQRIPGLRLARSYRRGWLRSDVVAGLVLAAILVPQGMAYAELAGLPPVTGLYTTIACLVGYAIFGPSRVLVLGPDSSVSPLIFAAITPLIVTGDPGSAVVLAGMLALLVGVIEIGLGLGKLGFVADLLSSEVQVGYMNGLAVTIVVSQLPKLFGFSTDADSFGDEVREFFEHLDETQTAALLVGAGALVILLVLPRITRVIPAVLVAVAGATILSAALDLAAEGVATVGSLPSGLPRPSLPWTSIDDVGPLVLAAIGIVLVSLTDTIATASSFAARRGDELEPNQEMIGIGAANVAAGFFQGFAISTSGSRTAVAEQAGAKSQARGPRRRRTPGRTAHLLQLVARGSPAVRARGRRHRRRTVAARPRAPSGSYARVRPSSAVLSLVATLGVIALGVLQGIVVAIFLAVLLFFRRSWWPHGAVLGRVDGTEGWHDVTQLEGATEVDGVLVYRWEAPLFFANAGAFRQQIRRLVRERQPAWVVLQCEAITDIDVTAAAMLEQLDRELNADGRHMAFVELRSRLHDLVHRHGLFETLDREHFYPSIETALAAIEEGR